ncbi:snRNA-activating protein complex subunit 3 [Drosophila rhopaloa]|uniref:snRNA-activating protein complex subunit 3 n=1 Tax=Drosophila rhopaloa TaxID=1041015 RepID=A0A6P4E1H0_DRORH|nr:snRNA-activating protein complex subunit 3 [Drosophila rhopaloa]
MESHSTVSALNLKDFLADYQQKLNTEDNVPFFMQSNPVIVDVGDSCSLNLIESPDDISVPNFQPGADVFRPTVVRPQDDQHVPATYSALIHYKTKSRKCAFGRTQYSHKLNPPPTDCHDLQLDACELELTVRLYRPPRAYHRGFKVEIPVFAEEYVCLGSNYLSELRDKISCVCRGKRFVDISNDPDAPLPTIDTNPGYFFINDTFYNDKRNPNNPDYSDTVLKWAAHANGVRGETLKAEDMEGKRFIDLTVIPGSPLHYLHHGNCEHLFVISQIEVLTPRSKRPDRSLYPYPHAFSTYNRRTCYMCGIRSYSFIVDQSRRQLHDPSYLCRSCFLSFYYVDGQKVGQFKAYRIYDHAEAEDEEEERKGCDDGDMVVGLDD